MLAKNSELVDLSAVRHFSTIADGNLSNFDADSFHRSSDNWTLVLSKARNLAS